MNMDKKLNMKDKIIHRLQEENKSLLEQNERLEKMVNDYKEIVEEANKCHETYEHELIEIRNLKEKYLQLTEDVQTYKKNCKKELNSLLKTAKKNI